jgi:putative component of membrane protein insertase Oxa1/YidC/SpoIIIJ protein YidD
MKLLKFYVLILSCFLFPCYGFPGEYDFQAEYVEANYVNKDKKAEHSDGKQKEGKNPLLSSVSFFRKYISSVDSNRCSMSPTCSAYSAETIKKHGAVIGWIMTCDRLMRCGGDEFKNATKVFRNDEISCYDPVDNNDFWWK